MWRENSLIISPPRPPSPRFPAGIFLPEQMPINTTNGRGLGTSQLCENNKGNNNNHRTRPHRQRQPPKATTASAPITTATITTITTTITTATTTTTTQHPPPRTVIYYIKPKHCNNNTYYIVTHSANSFSVFADLGGCRTTSFSGRRSPSPIIRAASDTHDAKTSPPSPSCLLTAMAPQSGY